MPKKPNDGWNEAASDDAIDVSGPKTGVLSSRAIYAVRLREDVATLWQRGLVPIAISDKVGISVTGVGRILNELGFTVPSYLTLTGPRAKKPVCAHCGKRPPDGDQE